MSAKDEFKEQIARMAAAARDGWDALKDPARHPLAAELAKATSDLAAVTSERDALKAERDALKAAADGVEEQTFRPLVDWARQTADDMIAAVQSSAQASPQSAAAAGATPANAPPASA
jgi:hypothetical protein